MSARVFGKKFPDPAQQSGCDVTNVPYVDYTLLTLPQTTRVITSERALQLGATLKEMDDLFQSHGIPAERVYADDSSLEDFRTRTIEALSHSDSSRAIIVNFIYEARTSDGYVQAGHYCPLAAYHENSDRFLLLDVWIDGPKAWYSAQEMFDRMDTFDGDIGRKRGFLIIGWKAQS